jgi:hypothetical protein
MWITRPACGYSPRSWPTPRLPDAACIGHHQLFDPQLGNGDRAHRAAEHARMARAATLCATCPARPECPTVVTSTSTAITVAVGVQRVSTRVRTSIPPPPGTLPAANLSNLSNLEPLAGNAAS